MSKKSDIIYSIIKEMQNELDAFFRAKKARKVQLTGDDILYLEVMLAQAIGAGPNNEISSMDTLVSIHAQRFLRDFFTLKTKPQVQLRESTFKIIQTMVEQSIERALIQLPVELSCSGSAESTDSSRNCNFSVPSCSPSPMSSAEVRKVPSPKNLFNYTRFVNKRKTTDGHWLRRLSSSGNETSPTQSPVQRQQSILRLPVLHLSSIRNSNLNQNEIVNEAELNDEQPMERVLPLKKRRASVDDAIVPNKVSKAFQNNPQKGPLKIRIIRSRIEKKS